MSFSTAAWGEERASSQHAAQIQLQNDDPPSTFRLAAEETNPAAEDFQFESAPRGGGDGGRQAPLSERDRAGAEVPYHLGVSGNPAAVNINVGTGKLGRLLGLSEDSGLRLGGVWVGDASGVLSGGVEPGQWGLNNLIVADLSLDAGKRWGWHGCSFGTQFLDFTGQPTNSLAGTVQGFDGIQSSPPLNRTELYQLWWRQEWFDGKLITRLGKSVPSYDFGNVLAGVPVHDAAYNIPAVTSLIYTPIFVNPTMLGRLPGYYDSSTGISMTLLPTEHAYISYGFFDGNNAHGHDMGMRGPLFNGNYFHIGEIGTTWMCGPLEKPGKVGVGLWGQSGQLSTPSGDEVDGDGGAYMFASQRLWFRHPGRDNSGISGFMQLGANNSDALLVRKYVGCGFTAFGLVRGRPKDSQGIGMAWAFLNNEPTAGSFFFPGPPASNGSQELRSNELMLQAYYQFNLWDGAIYQPTLTYIPNPGVRNDVPAAFALSNYLIMLF
ncbi:MAG: carbohydrate porin [Pirellulales bacterium]|nr:carbohydrate porin [Pirellulales bacterium]